MLVMLTLFSYVYSFFINYIINFMKIKKEMTSRLDLLFIIFDLFKKTKHFFPPQSFKIPSSSAISNENELCELGVAPYEFQSES